MQEGLEPTIWCTWSASSPSTLLSCWPSPIDASKSGPADHTAVNALSRKAVDLFVLLRHTRLLRITDQPGQPSMQGLAPHRLSGPVAERSRRPSRLAPGRIRFLLGLVDFRVEQISRPAFDLARAEVEESADSGKEPDFVGASDGFVAENLVLSLDRVDAIAGEIRQLDSILRRVEKGVTAAAKRKLRRMGHTPLHLNSREARRILSLR